VKIRIEDEFEFEDENGKDCEKRAARFSSRWLGTS
jgi:hypothetical protein